MSQHLLDRTIIIRNRWLIEEMRDFGRYDGEEDVKVEGMDSNDDMVMSSIIAMSALHQSGKRQEWAESAGLAGDGAKHAYLLPKCPQVFSVYNQIGQQVQQVLSEAEGLKFIDDIAKKHNIPNLRQQWKVIPMVVGKYNTVWSPAWDSTGAEHELMQIHGVSPRDQMQSKNLIPEYRKFMHASAKYGDDILSTDYSDEYESLIGEED